MIRWALRLLSVLALLPAALGAQALLATEPALPRRGTLARLIVTPPATDSLEGLDGWIAGEPLHLVRQPDGRWTSLFGIPIEGDDTIGVVLAIARPAAVPDTERFVLPVTSGDYPAERLRVAPAMAEPDSAARVRIDREIRQARQVSRESHLTPLQWSEPFLPPRPTRVTSRYGTGREFNGKTVSRHMGTDFAGSVGSPVRAANRGRVALVANFYLAGKVVYLDHGQGLISAYFHLSRADVQEGQTVERGQIIGRVGQSGRVTGPHLHWVTRYGATTVDPQSVLALLGASAPTGDDSAGTRR